MALVLRYPAVSGSHIYLIPSEFILLKLVGTVRFVALVASAVCGAAAEAANSRHRLGSLMSLTERRVQVKWIQPL